MSPSHLACLAALTLWSGIDAVPLQAQTGPAPALPRQGLYRTAGSGQTIELSAISASSMRVRQWQTETPAPPESRSAFYSTGAARLLGDGVTWRAESRDMPGYCCGNNVASEIRFLSPTRFTITRYRLWPLTAAAPGEGDLWQPTGANEWTLVGEIATPASPGGRPVPAPAPPGRPPVPGLVDSGARFSSLSGQVEIYHEGQSPKEATFAKMGTVIYVNDHIITREGSSAIIGEGDMSTFLLQEESEVVIGPLREMDSKLKLVAGKIWANIRIMARNGTFEFEDSNGGCGVKGTTVVATVYGPFITYQVIEGAALVTSRRRPESATLRAGQEVDSTPAGLSAVRAFDVAAEAASWKRLLTATARAAPIR